MTSTQGDKMSYRIGKGMIMTMASPFHDAALTPAAAPAAPAQKAVPPEARETIRARLRSELSDLDYIRALARWSATGISQREMASHLGLTQPAISQALTRRGDVPPALPGFAGAGPLEIAKRYAAGELTRAQLVEQLVAFPYVRVERDPYDDVTPDPPGAWSEVSLAHQLGYIDDHLYDEVHTRRKAERTGATAYLGLSGEAVEPSPQARERKRLRASNGDHQLTEADASSTTDGTTSR